MHVPNFRWYFGGQSVSLEILLPSVAQLSLRCVAQAGRSTVDHDQLLD